MYCLFINCLTNHPHDIVILHDMVAPKWKCSQWRGTGCTPCLAVQLQISSQNISKISKSQSWKTLWFLKVKIMSHSKESKSHSLLLDTEGWELCSSLVRKTITSLVCNSDIEVLRTLIEECSCIQFKFRSAFSLNWGVHSV